MNEQQILDRLHYYADGARIQGERLLREYENPTPLSWGHTLETLEQELFVVIVNNVRRWLDKLTTKSSILDANVISAFRKTMGVAVLRYLNHPLHISRCAKHARTW